MDERRRRGLIGLNVALVVVLGAVTLSPGAGAQSGADRPRGTYGMVSGQMVGGSADAIHIVDQTNSELVTLRFNQTSKSLDGIGFARFADDRDQDGGGR